MTSLFHQADCCKDSLLEYFALLTQVLMLVRIPLLVLKYPSMKRDFQTCVHIFTVFLAMPLRKQILETRTFDVSEENSLCWEDNVCQLLLFWKGDGSDKLYHAER